MWVAGPSLKFITRKLMVQKQPPEVFYKKAVLKTPVWRLFFNKVAGWRPAT